MIVVTDLDGLRHRIASVEPDPRIVQTACGRRVAVMRVVRRVRDAARCEACP